MRRLLGLLLAVGLVACAGVAHANQLSNAGFEAPISGGPIGNWATFAFDGAVVQDTTEPRSGTAHGLVFINSPGTFAGLFQNLPIPVNPGDVVQFSGWHKSLLDDFNATYELKLEWFGAPEFRVDTFELGTEYERFVHTGVAPPGTTGVRVTYALSSGAAGQSEAAVYIDDFFADIIPEPTSMMLLVVGVVGMFGLARRG